MIDEGETLVVYQEDGTRMSVDANPDMGVVDLSIDDPLEGGGVRYTLFDLTPGEARALADALYEAIELLGHPDDVSKPAP
jgi:hypothetical protein